MGCMQEGLRDLQDEHAHFTCTDVSHLLQGRVELGRDWCWRLGFHTLDRQLPMHWTSPGAIYQACSSCPW